ncbi:MAG: urease subunit gamma/beta [Chloroflexota bacterium]|jgi:urease subunit gamma/beta|nr:urease subunit gamma/beta [Chloroflexota bacterium]
MRLTPWEEERLLIFSAAELARRHRAAGLALNAPEAIALMCDAMLEAARAGASYATVEAAGLAAVAPSDVLPGVRELIDDVRLEVLLDDGTRLIVLVDPLGRGLARAEDGPGAVNPATADANAPALAPAATPERERRMLEVTSTSRRVIRISSHFPFHLANARLVFDRERAMGFRLDIEAGSSERWAPGETHSVALVRFGGSGGTEA